jgi:hypothetical protein
MADDDAPFPLRDAATMATDTPIYALAARESDELFQRPGGISAIIDGIPGFQVAPDRIRGGRPFVARAIERADRRVAELTHRITKDAETFDQAAAKLAELEQLSAADAATLAQAQSRLATAEAGAKSLPDFMRERFGAGWEITSNKQHPNPITREAYNAAKKEYDAVAPRAIGALKKQIAEGEAAQRRFAELKELTAKLETRLADNRLLRADAVASVVGPSPRLHVRAPDAAVGRFADAQNANLKVLEDAELPTPRVYKAEDGTEQIDIGDGVKPVSLDEEVIVNIGTDEEPIAKSMTIRELMESIDDDDALVRAARECLL